MLVFIPFSHVKESVWAKSLELWLPRRTHCSSWCRSTTWTTTAGSGHTDNRVHSCFSSLLLLGIEKCFPTTHIGHHRNTVFLVLEVDDFHSGNGWKRVFALPLLPCSFLSTKLLGTLSRIAGNGFFFSFLCTISVTWMVSRCLQAIEQALLIWNLIAKLRNEERKWKSMFQLC